MRELQKCASYLAEQLGMWQSAACLVCDRAGAEFGSPLWTFVDEDNAVPETDLDTIASRLRAVAEWWLDVVQPYRLEALKARRKRKSLRLSDLRKPLRDKPVETEVLRGLFDKDLEVKPLEQRIVATIVGVSGGNVPRT